ncbi:hypothetical protein K438DRAFT_1999924 [Mycena galopus ATCC 62051]|nr:hypothetical protein K438DRAFT_1999924 [Mycena galopus ATCC 62051]
MGDDPHSPPAEGHSSEFMSSPGYNPSTQPSAAFIANSRNFSISGGQFIHITNYAPSVPVEFRTIPLGDLDLRKEIRLDEYGVVNRVHGQRAARRIYTARVEGKQSDMTVALYQGEHAQQVVPFTPGHGDPGNYFVKTWKSDLEKYTGLRHPNFVQPYGTVNSGGLYATIFHDDLVPFAQFLDEYQHSVISSIYFDTELKDAEGYFQSLFGESRSACWHVS